MSDGEVIIDVDADTNKAEKAIEEKLKEISRKKAELNIQLSNNSKIKSELFGIQNLIDSISSPPPEMKERYSELFNVFSEGQQKAFLLQSQINTLSKEYSRLATSGATESMSNGLNNLNKHLAVSNILTKHFGRRIYNLLRNAFIFNVLMRGFRGLSTLLGNLINRDTILAKTLIVVKANLIRAFAPVWQIVLPIIRALGEGLVWVTNQLIRFINFLTGSKIEPLNIGDWKIAKKVVGDFYKEVSPKKELFPEIGFKKQEAPAKKVSKQTKQTRKNLEKTAKSSKDILASFDKLEVLDFKDVTKPLENVAKELIDPINNDIDSKLDLNVDEPSIEQQISNAINNIENAPLDFNVSDGIDDQILSQINGLNLPTLDFKVNDHVSNVVEKIKNKLSSLGNVYEKVITWIGKNQWVWKVVAAGIAGIGTALVVANIGKGIANIVKWVSGIQSAIKLFIGLFSGPGGWAALIVGALVLIALNWEKIKETAQKCLGWLKEHVGAYLKPVKDWLDKIGKSLTEAFKKFVEFYNWVNYHLNNLGRGLGGFFRNMFQGGNVSVYNDMPQNVPKLAQGAILRGGDPFLAYLNDQPRGQTNIEAPLDTIVDAFRIAINESGINQQPQINITSSGSMSELVRMLNLKIQDEQTRVGTNFVKGINI